MFKLTPGDQVGIISPSANLSGPEVIAAGIEYLQGLGLQVVPGKHIFEEYRYMAGTPKQRAADIMEFYRNPQIKAIFSTSGGDGSQFILPYLNYEVIKNNPKPIFGFSDVTALQMAIYAQAGQPYYTGFLLKYDFREGTIPPLQKQSLKAIINGQKLNCQGGETQIGGTGEGILLGGCLSLFRNLCGTPYYPDLSGTILLIEDVEETTYKLDLMLNQIRQCPNFDKVKGIVFGEFYDCPVRREEDGTTDEVISFFCKDLHIPVIRNFPYGHGRSRYILPCGVPMHLDANNCALKQI